MTDAAAVSVDHFNPLLASHHQYGEAEFQAYDSIEIVSTFGQPQAEYAALRKGCALIDLPQRGILELTGKDRHTFLNNLLSNTTWNKTTKQPIAAGSGVYALFLNVRGRIVADMNVLELGDRTLIETDARKVELLRSTWDRYLFVEKVTMRDARASLHEIALHGPRSPVALRELAGIEIELQPLQSTSAKIGGVDVVIWRDDVCGVPGYHLISAASEISHIWNLLAPPLDAEVQRDEAGVHDGASSSTSDIGTTGSVSLPMREGTRRRARPVGWAAFNAARIEAGRALLDIDFAGAAADRPGAKFDSSTVEEPPSPSGAGILPAELGPAAFARAIDLSKCYIGQEVVARMHARKQVARQICGIRMNSDALPVAGVKVLDEADNEIGVVTSSTVSPILSNAALCLCYLKKPHFEIGRNIRIPAEGAVREGTVVELPFIKPTTI